MLRNKGKLRSNTMKRYNKDCTIPRGVRLGGTKKRERQLDQLNRIILLERYGFVSGARNENPAYAKLRSI